MPFCLMLDVDGVLVDGRPGDGLPWDEDLEQDLGVPARALHAEFFEPHWHDIVIGDKDMLPVLTEALGRIAPTVRAEAFIAYWFEMDSRIMDSVLADVRDLRGQGIPVVLATNQEHMRAEYLMTEMGLREEVDGIVYSAQSGCRKPQPGFYRYAQTVTGRAPEELLLVDDRKPNIEAARAAGWEAVHWDESTDLSAIVSQSLQGRDDQGNARRDPDENGWQSSAEAWIKRTGDIGDFSRQHVLDAPMLARVAALKPRTALDVGCGEGRFCRMLSDLGISTVGVDPVDAMIEEARRCHGGGTYLTGFAEDLPFDDRSFDLVVSYLTLIDIDALQDAVSEMARVLRPGGRALVANLTSFSTSSAIFGKRVCNETGEPLRPLGNYLKEEKAWFEWDGLRVRNWHRPLSTYMQVFLNVGMTLKSFEEPVPSGGPPGRVSSYQRMPYLMMMEWEK